MPLYKITILLKSNKLVTGVKEHRTPHMDIVYNYFKQKAIEFYGFAQIKIYDCVMISKQSPDYQEWMKAKKKKAGEFKYILPFEMENTDNPIDLQPKTPKDTRYPSLGERKKDDA